MRLQWCASGLNLPGLISSIRINVNSIPIDLPLTEDAKRVWVRFFNAHNLVRKSLEGDLAAAWSKLEAYAARLSLIIFLVRSATSAVSGDPAFVDKDSVAAGVELVAWFGRETTRIYRMMRESDQEKDRRCLVEHIERLGGRITARKLMRSSVAYSRSVADADEALQDLVDTKLGRWIPVTHGKHAGRPTRRFELLPTDIIGSPAEVQEDSVSELKLAQSLANEDGGWGEVA